MAKARSSGQAPNASRTGGLGKTSRELRDCQQVAGQPELHHRSMHKTVASGVESHQGSWAVGGGSVGGVGHATGAGRHVGVAASEGAGIGTNSSVSRANCSVMQGHDGPL
jgi:hypothetical protein